MKINSAGIETHFHNLSSFDIDNITKAMEKKNIDVIAIESRDPTFFLYLKENMFRKYGINSDSAGLIFSDKCFLNAVEYSTLEKFHVLVIGKTPFEKYENIEIRRIIDSALNYNSFVIIAHPFVDNDITKKAGHINQEIEYSLEAICKEYSGKIALEWNAHSIPFLRFLLQNGLNLLYYKTDYYDINKRAEEFSKYLEYQGYNLPIVAGTDSHPRNKESLLLMGTSRIITCIEGESAYEILSSIRKNIFKKDYKNVKKYSSVRDIISEIVLPLASEYIYQKIK